METRTKYYRGKVHLTEPAPVLLADGTIASVKYMQGRLKIVESEGQCYVLPCFFDVDPKQGMLFPIKDKWEEMKI